MIEAIGTGEGIMPATRDSRAADERRRPIVRRRTARGERIEIDDALAALGFEAEAAPADVAGGGATVTALLVARRLVAAGDRGIAAQARLRPAAVRRLIGGDA